MLYRFFLLLAQVETIIRKRIYETVYWKQECFALDAASLLDPACELTHVGGVYSALNKPTPFLCLLLKLLQLKPDKDVIVEYIKEEDFKYLRCLGAVYMRLVGTALDCYKYLEPLLQDFSKLKRMKRDGQCVYQRTTTAAANRCNHHHRSDRCNRCNHYTCDTNALPI